MKLNSFSEFIEYCRLITDELNVEQLVFPFGTYTRACPFHKPEHKEKWVGDDD